MPGIESLVEIHSLHGFFEWFGQAYLDEGHKVGFIAASDDHLGHPGYNVARPSKMVHRVGLAAVIAPAKTRDSIFDAMKARHAYATTVDRILLDARLNGHLMGDVVQTDDERNIEIEVMGTAPIDTVSVIKNGQTFWTESYRDDPELSSEQDIEVVFYSPSHPLGMVPDNPRPWRVWSGTIEVQGAVISDVSKTWNNVHLAKQLGDSDDAQVINFTTWTRGENRRVRLSLSGATQDTTIKVNVLENLEMPTAPATQRKPQLVPGVDFEVNLGEVQGAFEHRQQVDAYEDVITVRLTQSDADRHKKISIVDDTPVRKGDYYYIRVEQANSGLAWSSPFFVEPSK